MADSTIVLRSPVKSTPSSFTPSPSSSSTSTLNSPLHHSTVIILKDNNSKKDSPATVTQTSSASIRNSSHNQSTTLSVKTVQPKLYYAGHTGLYNLGNTCYVNCVLQLLSHVPQFCDAICSMSFESLGLEQPSDVPQVASSHNPTRLKGGGRGLLKALEAQPRRVPCYLAYELHGTFNIIWSGKCMVYSPLNMIAAVRRLLPTFEPCAMEDAQEFLEALLAAVTDEIKTNKLADTNIINDLLGFSSESQILCEQCHRLSVTKTDETFITLTFSEKMLCDSRGSSRRRSCHLTEMLAHFYQWEALSTPFQCSNCTVRSPSKEGTKAQKRLLISKLPQVLHVVLRRFRSLPQTNLRRPTSRQARQLSHKITMHVNFDEYLDMAPYCAPSHSNSSPSTRSKDLPNSSDECLYRLRGVIVHYGKSINTGHFVAFVYNDVLGEWLRCDDHIIEQTTFEAVKTSDAYILVYSRCAPNSTSSTVPSNPTVIPSPSSASPAQSQKRKRAISVDHLNEQKEEATTHEDKTEIKIEKENSDEKAELSKSFQVLCVNMDPLANGLRRRAQSLNIAIRSNQSNLEPSLPTGFTTPPVAKRRRREPMSNGFSLETDVTSQTKPVSPSVLQPVIQTRKKPSPTVNTSNSLSEPVKTNQTTRRRRRTDPFTRKRRMTKASERKRQPKMDRSNPVSAPSIDSSPSKSESLLPIVHSSPTANHENSISSTPKRIGRIRLVRCLDESNINATIRLIPSGDSNIRGSFPSPIIFQSSASSSSI